jgi:hypothetical protein
VIHKPGRFDTTHPNLCAALRWKSQFLYSESEDVRAQPSNDGLFWCLHTQTCIGPDGDLAEPGDCCSTDRVCHGLGQNS